MIALLLLALGGCPTEAPKTDDTGTPTDTSTTPPVDEDGDGFSPPEDCDDAERSVNPLAEESCNGADDDCDDAIDEDAVDQGTWYADMDEDGYGDAMVPVQGCEQPDQTSAIPGDCNDQDPAIRPAAVDTEGDGVDSDCDGSDG